MASDFSTVNLTQLLGLDRVTSAHAASDEKKRKNNPNDPDNTGVKVPTIKREKKDPLSFDDITNVSLDAVKALIKEDVCRVFDFYDDIDPNIDQALEAAEKPQNIAQKISVYEKRSHSGAGSIKETAHPFPFSDSYINSDDQKELFSGYQAVWDKIEILRINGITHIPHNGTRSVYESIQIFLDIYKGRL